MALWVAGGGAVCVLVAAVVAAISMCYANAYVDRRSGHGGVDVPRWPVLVAVMCMAVLAWRRFDVSWLTVSVIMVVGFGLPAALVDCQVRLLPARLSWLAAIGSCASLLTQTLVSGGWIRFWVSVACTGVLCAILYAVAVASRGGLGLGDVRYVAGIGMPAIWQSPFCVVLLPLIAFSGAAMLIALRRTAPSVRRCDPLAGLGVKRAAGVLPLGPFLLVAAVACVWLR